MFCGDSAGVLEAIPSENRNRPPILPRSFVCSLFWGGGRGGCAYLERATKSLGRSTGSSRRAVPKSSQAANMHLKDL